MSIRNLFLLCITASFLFANEARAQDEVPQDSVPPLEPIQLTDLPRFVEKVNTLGESIEALLVTPEAIAYIRDNLSKAIHEVDSSAALLEDTVSLSRLSNINNSILYWQNTRERTKQWIDEVNNRIKTLQEKNVEVEKQLEIAQLTYEDARNQQSPREVLATIQDATQNLEQFQARLNDILNRLFTRQAELVPLQEKVNKTLNDLDTRKKEMISNIWSPEAPPLWNLGETPSLKPPEPLMVHITKTYKKHWESFKLEWRAAKGYRYFLFIFFPLLSLYLIYFKHFIRKTLEELPGIDKEKPLLKNPVLAAIVITWICGVLTFSTSSDIDHFLIWAIVIPLAIIQYELTKNYSIQQITFLFVLILIYQFEYLLEGSFGYRLFMLIVSLGMTVVVALLMFTKPLEKVRLNLHPMARFVGHLFFLILIMGTIANVLGAVRLSELLTMGVVVSFLIAIILFQGVALSTDVVSVIMIGSPLVNSNIVIQHRDLIRTRAKQYFTLFAYFLWVYYSLKQFTIEDDVLDAITSLVTTSFEFGSVKISLGNILAFFLTLQVSIWLSRFIRFFLDEEIFTRTKQSKKGISGTITLLVRYAIISLGVVLAFAAAGIEFSKIAVLIGALGVGIGFGLQSIFNNLVSGIILAIERPIQVGDVIEVAGLMGTVREIGFRASVIRTFEGSEVIVPNGDLISSQMINWTHSDTRRRLEVKVGVEYGTDPQLVLDTLREVAESHDEVMKHPACIPRFIEYGDSALEFQLLYWIPDFDISFRVGTEMHKLVHDKLKEKNIEIAFPQLDVHVKDKGEE